jgi:hypothetical protein
MGGRDNHMNVSVEQLLAIIGGKEVENFLLKQQIEELRKQLAEAKSEKKD